MLSCEFCEISRNTFSYRTPPVAASEEYGQQGAKTRRGKKSDNGRTTRYPDNKTIIGDWNRCEIGRFGNRSRRNNLIFEGTKEHENESWEHCKNKIYNLLEYKLEVNIENVVIERARQTGKKNKNIPRPTDAQFSFYKDMMNILKNCKKLISTWFSIFKDVSRETAAISKEKWQEVLANREKRMISFLNYRTVICE